MQGSPPAPEKQIRFDDGSYFQFPQMRWSVTNFRQLMPTINVARGAVPVQPVTGQHNAAIDKLTFYPLGSDKPMSWQQALLENYTDGIVVLHRGQIIYERYFGVLNELGQHAAMSVTKTFTGTLAAMLVDRKSVV